MQDELARQGVALSLLQQDVGAMKVEMAIQQERTKAIPDHGKRLDALEDLLSEFRGASRAVRVLWMIGGAVGAGTLIKILESISK